jgi:hypothetical protein
MRWLISILALLFIVVPTGAKAEIVRSCSGALDGNIATIKGEGTCKNTAQANDCRARARAAIIECARDLYLARDSSNVLPVACQGGRGAKRAVLHWDQVILGIRGNDIGDRERWNQCCRGQDPKRKGSTQVLLQVAGDKGCGSTKIGKKLFQSDVVIGTIHFDCHKQRQNGLCDH